MTPRTTQKKPEPTLNRAFLLRVWRTANRGEARASLTDVETSEVHLFADLDRLSSWLETDCGISRDPRSQGSG